MPVFHFPNLYIHFKYTLWISIYSFFILKDNCFTQNFKGSYIKYFRCCEDMVFVATTQFSTYIMRAAIHDM